MDLSYFDAIYCINLYTRDDRYKASKDVLEGAGIPVTYYRTHKHPNGGLQGCFESHINVVNLAWNSGARNVLIFEDDLRADNATPEHLERAVSFMKKKSWDIFYLGAVPDYRRHCTRKVSGYPGVYSMSGICTHAYAINTAAMRKLKDVQYTGIPYDFYLRDTFRCFAIYPSLFYQGGFSSDIAEEGVDVHSWISPTLVNKWFKLSEAYAYHIGLSASKLAYVAALTIMWFAGRVHRRVPPPVWISLVAVLYVIFLRRD